MDNVTSYEPFKGTASTDSLEGKIQKLINNYSSLKDKYTLIKEERDKFATTNQELEDENNHLTREKGILVQKITQLEEELSQRTSDLNYMKETNLELDAITKTAVSKIDSILSQVDFDL